MKIKNVFFICYVAGFLLAGCSVSPYWEKSVITLRGDEWYGGCEREFVSPLKYAFVYECQLPYYGESTNELPVKISMSYGDDWQFIASITNYTKCIFRQTEIQPMLFVIKDCVPCIYSDVGTFPSVAYVLHTDKISKYDFLQNEDGTTAYVFDEQNSRFLPFSMITISKNNASRDQIIKIKDILLEFLGVESRYWCYDEDVIKIWALNASRGVCAVKLLSHKDFHEYKGRNYRCVAINNFDVTDLLWIPCTKLNQGKPHPNNCLSYQEE